MERFQPDYMASALSVLAELGEVARAHDPTGRVDAEHWEPYRFSVVAFRDKCYSLGLRASVGILDLIIKLLDAHVLPYEDLGTRTEQVAHLVDGELRASLFLCVSPGKARFYEEPLEGWDEAINKFPSVKLDVEEAGKSYALGRYPATVFHAMRILEIGLTALAKEHGVPFKYTNWQPAINQIKTEVSKMGKHLGADWQEKRQFYQEALAQFESLKDAWRNDIMHVRQDFDDERAKGILEHVRLFMARLSTRLAE